MTRQFKNALHFLRTTAIGGFVFLLPFWVTIGFLIYVHHLVVVVHTQLRPWIPLDTTRCIALLFSVALLSLLAVSFMAGLIARRAIGMHYSKTIEKQLIKMYPKYGIYKDLLAAKIGDEAHALGLHPVLIKRDGALYPAFQTDHLSNGLVMVYFPSAPDTWNGSIALVAPENVLPINAKLEDVLGLCERLGRNASEHLDVAREDLRPEVQTEPGTTNGKSFEMLSIQGDSN